MPSIFQLALGTDFDRLHPQMRRRFGFTSSDQTGCIGSGVMGQIWRRGSWMVPFLWLGTHRHVLFPDRGTDVPFTIENYAYLDSFRRETLTFVRTFEIRPTRRRRFDATMVYNPDRGCVVDYLGTHQHLAVAVRLAVAARVAVDQHGGLWVRSGRFRLLEGRLSVPIPAVAAGRAQLHEWYDENEQRFRIEVQISHPWVGPMLGYSGSFTTSYLGPGQPVPAAVKPLREEIRC